MVPTHGEPRVRLFQEVSRLDVVQCRRLVSRLDGQGVVSVEVDRVGVEVVSSACVVEVTVGTDDDAWPVVLVN